MGGSINWYLDQSFDEVVRKIITIDSVHHEVHEGILFMAEHSASIDNGNDLEMLIVVGAKAAHTIFAVSAGGQLTAYLFEDSSKTGGTAITERNMNRTKSDARTNVTVTHTPGGAGDGVAIVNGRLLPGGATPQTRVGGAVRGNSEIILRPSTVYLLRLTNTSGSTIVINPVLEYYEE